MLQCTLLYDFSSVGFASVSSELTACNTDYEMVLLSFTNFSPKFNFDLSHKKLLRVSEIWIEISFFRSVCLFSSAVQFSVDSLLVLSGSKHCHCILAMNTYLLCMQHFSSEIATPFDKYVYYTIADMRFLTRDLILVSCLMYSDIWYVLWTYSVFLRFECLFVTLEKSVPWVKIILTTWINQYG